MTENTALPDHLAMTPDNLWVAVYRDRMRGGVGYEYILTTPGEAGRVLAHKDPTTLMALSLSELEGILQSLSTVKPLRAEGALNWLPVGMGRQIVWSYKNDTPSAQLVLARSAETAAELVAAQGGQIAATTDLSQIETIISEMKDVLKNEDYEKILSDLRPEAGGFGENWLEMKKDPVLARMNELLDILDKADERDEKDPTSAQELFNILSQDGVSLPIPDLMEYLDRHLGR